MSTRAVKWKVLRSLIKSYFAFFGFFFAIQEGERGEWENEGDLGMKVFFFHSLSQAVSSSSNVAAFITNI